MIERDVKAYVLRALLAGKGAPPPDDTIKAGVRAAFPGVAFTEGDLTQYLRELERAGLIAGTDDEIYGTVWMLTAKGKIKAQQLA